MRSVTAAIVDADTGVEQHSDDARRSAGANRVAEVSVGGTKLGLHHVERERRHRCLKQEADSKPTVLVACLPVMTELVAVRASEAKGRIGCVHENTSVVELLLAMNAFDESAQVLFTADAW